MNDNLIQPKSAIRHFCSVVSLAYIIFVCWMSTFALGPWLRIPTILAIAVAVSAGLSAVVSMRLTLPRIFGVEDAFIGVGIVALMLVTLVHGATTQSFGYISAYFFVFGVQYLFLKAAFASVVTAREVLWANVIGVCVVCCYVLLETFAQSVIGFDIQSVLPRSREASAYYASQIRRAYGPTTEPTMLALYFNTLGPLAIHTVWETNRRMGIAFGVIAILCWSATWSAAGVACLLLGLGSVAVIYAFRSVNRLIKTLVTSTVAAAIIITILVMPGVQRTVSTYSATLIEKITLSPERRTSGSRETRWIEDWAVFADNALIGVGLGENLSESRGSSTNWYLYLAVQGGIVSVLPFVLFIAGSYLRIIRSSIRERWVVMISFIAGATHFLTASVFFHPYLWLLIAIFWCLEYSHLSKKRHQIRSEPPASVDAPAFSF